MLRQLVGLVGQHDKYWRDVAEPLSLRRCDRPEERTVLLTGLWFCNAHGVVHLPQVTNTNRLSFHVFSDS